MDKLISPAHTLFGWFLCVVVCAGGAGCLAELEHRVNCGDGYRDVDEDAGEDCDPLDPDEGPLYAACAEAGLSGGAAECHPRTCKTIVSEEICAVCGDGIVSPGEACDTDDLNGERCLSGEDALRCNDDCTLNYDSCPLCGNGVPDPGEECDWMSPVSDPDYEDEVPCNTLKRLGSIQIKDYASGSVAKSECTNQCLLPRNNCSFCGDEQLDEEYHDKGSLSTTLDLMSIDQPGELCDGEEVEQEDLRRHCGGVCVGDEDTLLELRCDFECDDKCEKFVPLTGSPTERRCCIRIGPCDDVIPCCYSLDNPTEDGCVGSEAEGGRSQSSCIPQ